jgi:hypothetical protein
MTIPRVSRELVETRAKEQLDIDKIKEAWIDMALENPYLFSAVSNTAQAISEERPVQNGFLKGAYLVWSLLKSQEQVNQMNDDWGF